MNTLKQTLNYRKKIQQDEITIFLGFEAVMPLSASSHFPECKLKNLLVDLDVNIGIKCDILTIENEEIALHRSTGFSPDNPDGVIIEMESPVLTLQEKKWEEDEEYPKTDSIVRGNLGSIMKWDNGGPASIDIDNYQTEDLIKFLGEKAKKLIQEYKNLDDDNVLGKEFSDFTKGNDIIREICEYALSM